MAVFPAPSCPLCRRASGEPGEVLRGVTGRRFFLCPRCALVFAPPESRPDPAASLARYELHRNSIEDPGYVRFLLQLWNAARPRLSPGMAGIDYGSGPEAVLAELVRRSGFDCVSYDPFFPGSKGREGSAGDPWAAEGSFDFVLASEVFEHFGEVDAEIAKVLRLLRPGGILGVMTEARGPVPFERWPYTSDPTHVCFYGRETMAWIERRYGLELLEHDGRRVWVFSVAENPAGGPAPAPPSTPPETPPG